MNMYKLYLAVFLLSMVITNFFMAKSINVLMGGLLVSLVIAFILNLVIEVFEK